jgi:hypothetical protein
VVVHRPPRSAMSSLVRNTCGAARATPQALGGYWWAREGSRACVRTHQQLQLVLRIKREPHPVLLAACRAAGVGSVLQCCCMRGMLHDVCWGAGGAGEGCQAAAGRLCAHTTDLVRWAGWSAGSWRAGGAAPAAAALQQGRGGAGQGRADRAAAQRPALLIGLTWHAAVSAALELHDCTQAVRARGV